MAEHELQEAVLYEIEGEVALVTLNRPQSLNAVNHALVAGLNEALDRARTDGARAVVLRGAGRAFCAGHDLKQDPEEATDTEALERLQMIQDVTRKIRRLAAPVIAAVHGYALGAGCEFALCCDLVVAGREAVFGFPEVEVGLAATGGITHLLPQVVGGVRAKRMVFLGDRIDAAEAERLGLVNVVVDDAMAKAKEWAATLATRPRLALALAKACLDQGPAVDIETAYGLELGASLALMNTEEALQAAESFRSSHSSPLPVPPPREEEV